MFTVLLRELQVQDSEEQGGDWPRGHVEHGHHEQLHHGGGVTITVISVKFMCGHVEHGHHEQLHNGGGVTITVISVKFMCGHMQYGHHEQLHNGGSVRTFHECFVFKHSLLNTNSLTIQMHPSWIEICITFHSKTMQRLPHQVIPLATTGHLEI